MHPELDTSVFVERRFNFAVISKKKRSALFYFLMETQKKVAITVTSAEGM